MPNRPTRIKFMCTVVLRVSNAVAIYSSTIYEGIPIYIHGITYSLKKVNNFKIKTSCLQFIMSKIKAATDLRINGSILLNRNKIFDLHLSC